MVQTVLLSAEDLSRTEGEFLLGKAVRSPPLHYTSVSLALCVFISAEQELPCREDAVSSTIRWAGTPWLVLEEGRLSAWVTQTICSSPVSTSFPSIEALSTPPPVSFFQTQSNMSVCWERLAGGGFAKSGFHHLTSDTFDSLSALRWPSSCSSCVGSALGRDTSGRRQLLVLGAGAQSDWAAAGARTWMCLPGPP